MSEVVSLAQTLEVYGGWGLAAILMVALVVLFLRFEGRIHKEDADHKEQLKSGIELVIDVTEASHRSATATLQVTEALKALERRLENVEKKLG